MNAGRELEMLDLNLPATNKYLNVVAVCIDSMLEQDIQTIEMGRVIYNIKLATHELCMNIVDHAYAGRKGRIDIRFSCTNEPRQFIIDVHDTGDSFSMPEIHQPNEAEIQTSGYGLFLIHRLMDLVDYEPQPNQNHWRLMKQL